MDDYGYYTSYGFYGKIGDDYILFVTEEEYFEALKEEESNG